MKKGTRTAEQVLFLLQREAASWRLPRPLRTIWAPFSKRVSMSRLVQMTGPSESANGAHKISPSCYSSTFNLTTKRRQKGKKENISVYCQKREKSEQKKNYCGSCRCHCDIVKGNNASRNSRHNCSVGQQHSKDSLLKSAISEENNSDNGKKKQMTIHSIIVFVGMVSIRKNKDNDVKQEVTLLIRKRLNEMTYRIQLDVSNTSFSLKLKEMLMHIITLNFNVLDFIFLFDFKDYEI